ncbi:MAG: DM13 domain-containing protein, partial [Nitrosopumilaceae archaeon]
MHKGAIIGIIAAVIAIGGFLASPLFYETEVNEPLPIALNEIEEGLTFEKFVEMDDDKRVPLVEEMPEKVEDMIMEKAATMVIPVSESMDDMTQESDSTSDLLKSGMFEGLAGHSAEGTAKIIQVNEMTFLRFENFQVTNGPDLRVYITPDGDVKNGI